MAYIKRRGNTAALSIGLMLTCMAPTSPSVAQSVDEVGISAHVVLEDRYPTRRHEFANGVTSHADVVFSTVPGFRPLTLDLYSPPDEPAGTRPLVIVIHGGGWIGGHTRHSGAFSNWPEALAAIAREGYVVASVEYRLSGEAPFPAAFEDIKAAIRWLRAHSEQYGIDKRRTILMGGSAGGQLAGLAGTACGDTRYPEPELSDEVVESACVQGVVTWYGVFDFGMIAPTAPTSDGRNVPDVVGRYLGCSGQFCSEKTVREASAISFVDRSDPPFLMIHGVDDTVVAIEQSQVMQARLEQAGVDSTLIEIPGVNHSFIGKTAKETMDASRDAFEASLEFIEQTIGDR